MMQRVHADLLLARIPVLWRALAAVAVLCAALLLLVEARARILRSGVEVRLRTAPVEPRDLFRGDYVVLNYDVSTVDEAGAASEKPLRRGEPVFVRLRPGPDGFAQAVGLERAPPANPAGDIVIRGQILSTGACLRNDAGLQDCARGRTGVRLAYGLESYFVPQGAGLAIERTDRARVEVVAAVSSSGEAAIKRLLIDGKLVHAEPPY